MTPTTAVHATGLVKTFDGFRAVDGIDLEVRQGEIFGVLGPNGAGKTTTLKMLATLLPIDAGQAHVFGVDVAREPHRIRQLLGVTGQYASVDEDLTATENLWLFGRLQGLRSGDARATAKRLLEQFSLQEAADKPIAQFSGGMRRRLDLAASLITRPPLIFLDEPTTGLDPQSRRQVWDIVNGFKTSGRTVMLTTHYMDEAERLCDRVAIVDHGRIIAEGPPRDLMTSLGGEHMVEIAVRNGDAGQAAAAMEGLPGVRAARLEAGRIVLNVTEPHLAVPAALERLRAGSWTLSDLSTRHASLEDVFVSLTGRHLRDE
jgi:daunorubicin/doxorubicin transport system ATP-binding protein